MSMCQMPHGEIPCNVAYPDWWVAFIFIFTPFVFATIWYWLFLRSRNLQGAGT